MCVECVLCVFPCVLTRYSFYCDIVICGAIWAAAGAAPIYGAALSEVTLYSFTLVTAWVNIQEDEVVTFFIFGGFPCFLDGLDENERICNKLFGPPDPATHHSPMLYAPHTFYNYTK